MQFLTRSRSKVATLALAAAVMALQATAAHAQYTDPGFNTMVSNAKTEATGALGVVAPTVGGLLGLFLMVGIAFKLIKRATKSS